MRKQAGSKYWIEIILRTIHWLVIFKSNVIKVGTVACSLHKKYTQQLRVQRDRCFASGDKFKILAAK